MTPTFGAATSTADGFTVQISNYDSSYTWAGTATASGTVAINGAGLVTVTGVAAATSSTATITTTKAGTVGGSATVTAISLSADYSVTISNNAITITSYIGAGGAVTIPATIGGLPVVAIGAQAFAGCTGLTSVTIPSSVTSIENSAFYGCTGLTAITVDAGNLSYSSNAGVLYNKSQTTLVQCPGGLTSVTIPSSVTSIGTQAFYGCTGLTAITVDAGNLFYSSNAGVLYNKFQTTLVQCPGGLTSVTIPSSVTSIGDYAFRSCIGLASVTIPSSVTSIGYWTFYGCSGLIELNFLGAPPQLGGTLSNINTTIVKYPKGSGATTWASYVGTLFGGLITQEST